MKQLNFILMLLIAVFVSKAQSTPADTKSIIKEACREAGNQNKNVFIIFHASWCIWCHKMDSSINDATCKEFFDDNYVIKHITVFEVKEKAKLNNAGAEEFLAAHHAAEQGIPAWFIFDKDGNLLSDSQLRPKNSPPGTEGSNVGCPANGQEIDYFISVLEKTSNISDKEKEAIRKRFAKNADTMH
jgi:thiol-disulfide isomerase/thioredoxin